MASPPPTKPILATPEALLGDSNNSRTPPRPPLFGSGRISTLLPLPTPESSITKLRHGRNNRARAAATSTRTMTGGQRQKSNGQSTISSRSRATRI
ncbi:unnamed protein product [Linum trigynum]|uniref:Uncharacterized protein n=1 Tax=Linum trigynum TaxID=586398 RepID=A0AAV2DA10_9ROSI